MKDTRDFLDYEFLDHEQLVLYHIRNTVKEDRCSSVHGLISLPEHKEQGMLVFCDNSIT